MNEKRVTRFLFVDNTSGLSTTFIQASRFQASLIRRFHLMNTIESLFVPHHRRRREKHFPVKTLIPPSRLKALGEPNFNDLLTRKSETKLLQRATELVEQHVSHFHDGFYLALRCSTVDNRHQLLSKSIINHAVCYNYKFLIFIRNFRHVLSHQLSHTRIYLARYRCEYSEPLRKFLVEIPFSESSKAFLRPTT